MIMMIDANSACAVFEMDFYLDRSCFYVPREQFIFYLMKGG